jgi:hypothetical protein
MPCADDGHAEPELSWEQGSLLPANAGVAPLQWVHPDHPASKIARGFVGQARRYSRPAVPDEDYPVVIEPIRRAWKRLLAEDPQAAERYNREYAEWRYRREQDSSLTIYILSPREDPDEVTALEVTDLLTQALQGRYPGRVRVATDKRSYFTFTKADELTSEQIDMEWASHDEQAGDGEFPA